MERNEKEKKYFTAFIVILFIAYPLFLLFCGALFGESGFFFGFFSAFIWLPVAMAFYYESEPKPRYYSNPAEKMPDYLKTKK